DGADFEPDISIQVEPVNQGDPSLRASGVELRELLIAKLGAQGSLPVSFYPDLAKTDDPASGFVLAVLSPRFSTGYFPQRNRFTVLVETHSWKPYEMRLRAMRNAIVGLAELAATHGAKWLNDVQRADAGRLGGNEIVLDYAAAWREPAQAGGTAATVDDAGARIIEFRGYAYTREPSLISGDRVTIYDPKTPQIWSVPYRDRVQPSLTVTAPRGGYVVSAGYAEFVQSKLALHGIRCEPVAQSRDEVPLQTFRAERVEFAPVPFEGCMRATLHGRWRDEPQPIPAGSLFVPMAQRNARLVMALLEPQAPDSLAAWGFFNACFEQKEQVEPYVAEQIAREMLAASSGLRAEFEYKVAADAAFAADPSARLGFFLRRHASWDPYFNLYPVYR
ncbi:MAG: peptidase M14, partial [Steroidobacteraceae bacterium]